MPAVADRDADARADEALVLTDAHRQLETLDDTFRQLFRTPGIAAVEQQHELVATGARKQGFFRHQLAEAIADLYQQLVPYFVAEAVIDALEVIQVEVEQAQRQASCQQLVEALHQVVAVGQLGQRIEVGEKAQPLFGAQSVADIAQQDQEMAHAVALEGRAADLQRNVLTVAAAGQLQRRVRRRAAQACGGIAFGQAVARQVADELPRGTAEQGGSRRVGLQHAQLAVDHQHADRRRVDQVA